MSDYQEVVVYGASGYTGRLVCEYLREYNVPFIAAGRDKARIAEALETVPGIGTVEHEIVEVEHAVGPLSELFDGARWSATWSGRSPPTGPRWSRRAWPPAAITSTPPASRTG